MNCLEEKIINAVNEKLKYKDSLIIAIDGRCASGKTTLAMNLKNKLKCNVIHIDDFFLQPSMRTKERLDEAGGNFDRERFIFEVLIPLKEGRKFSYRPFNCKKGDFDQSINCNPSKITIVEGAYSCHPQLFDSYDITVFLSVSHEKQLERIVKRNGEKHAEIFKNKWIPLEEKYFTVFSVMEKCDIKWENN